MQRCTLRWVPCSHDSQVQTSLRHSAIVGRAWLMLAVLSLSAFAQADVIATVPETVARYARDLDRVRKHPGTVSLEPVFSEGLAAAAALEHGQLEQLDKPTYQKIQVMMAGFYISREEVVLAIPDAGFFLKLAKERGTRIDQAFFETERKTYPDGAWPAYTNQQTDYSGCTVHDGKTLTGLYGNWAAFQKSYPGHYRDRK